MFGGVPEWPIGTALKAVAGRDVSRGFESRPLCRCGNSLEPVVDPGRRTSLTPLMDSQELISREIAEIHAAAAEQPPDPVMPRLDFPPYRSSLLRHPTKELRHADPEGVELVAPVFGHSDVDALEADLTVQATGEPLGERITVAGRVLDSDGRPVRHQLVEIWQANAAGRYVHKGDQHPAPIDPAFTGAGRCLTGDDGEYLFTTIKPGPYPWRNHHNAWRPAHIHFSLFGTDFTQRLITQMYFPGDPLFALDPIYQSITDQGARDRLVATYDHEQSSARVVDGLPLGHRSHREPCHPLGAGGSAVTLAPTPGQTIGPFFHYALPFDHDRELVPPGAPGRCGCTATCGMRAGVGLPDALLEIRQADADGVVPEVEGSLRRDGTAFTGWGRSHTDPNGHYWFSTREPGATAEGGRRSSR